MSGSSMIERVIPSGTLISILPGQYKVLGKHSKGVSASVFRDFLLSLFDDAYMPPSNVRTYHKGDDVAMVPVVIHAAAGKDSHRRPEVPRGFSRDVVVLSLGALLNMGAVTQSAFREWHSARQERASAARRVAVEMDRATRLSEKAKSKAAKKRAAAGPLTYKRGSVAYDLFCGLEGQVTPTDGDVDNEVMKEGVAIHRGVKNAEGKNVANLLRTVMQNSGYNVTGPKGAVRIIVPDSLTAKQKKALPVVLQDPSVQITYSTFLSSYGVTRTAVEAAGAAGDYGLSDLESPSFEASAESPLHVEGDSFEAAAGAGRAPGKAAPPKRRRGPTAYNLYLSARSADLRPTWDEKTQGKWHMPTMTGRFSAEWKAMSKAEAEAYFAKRNITPPKFNKK